MNETLDKEKAVEIAKDVLLRLDQFKIVDKGIYIHLDNPSEIPKTGSIQDKLDNLIPSCQVCAMGALMIAYIDKYNNCNFEDFRLHLCSNLDIIYALKGFFSERNLKRIEKAFEGWDKGLAEYKFGLEYSSPRNRLRAICQNIIDNGGEFRP